MNQADFTFIDLFAGIGGFKLALSANGGKCIGFSEVDKTAISYYCKNYHISDELNFGDVREIKELPKHDIMTAGVPCQSWSIAGKNLGFDDDRGQLWNDTLYLLNQSQPKAFIFENVKGLADPRNKIALEHILEKIRTAGFYANFYVINSHDYGVAQNRIRVYIIGFRNREHYYRFKLPKPVSKKVMLCDILGLKKNSLSLASEEPKDLFGQPILRCSRPMSLSSKNGFNDYFLFNDLRNGKTTIHSWDIAKTSQRQKEICLMLLRSRRKRIYGPLDGNPLSISHFQSLDSSIEVGELNELVEMGILKPVDYRYEIVQSDIEPLTEQERIVLDNAVDNYLIIDRLKTQKKLKVNRIDINSVIQSLEQKGAIRCIEKRYDFKNGKISSGINGINRIFMPTSDVFPTLVASDSNDYVALANLSPSSHKSYKEQFLKDIYFKKNYRKITKPEACRIQGFPSSFELPEERSKWMKLIGNSVSVPVIDQLIKAIIKTGVFETTLPKENNSSEICVVNSRDIKVKSPLISP